MMREELLTAELRLERALRNDGVDPVSGMSVNDLLDYIRSAPPELEEFARKILDRILVEPEE